MAVASESFYRESSLSSDGRFGSGSRQLRGSSDFNRSHREMAVDVPDNYVAPKKESRFAAINKGRVGSREMDGKSSQQLSQSAAKLGKELDEHAQSARIKKYQDDLRKRRAEEERQQQEAEFLRTSLRGSHKLQALAKRLPPQTGVENPNYIGAEEPISYKSSVDSTDNATLPKEVLYRKPQSLDNLLSLLQNLQNRSDSADIRNGIQEVSRLLENQTVQHAAVIHKKVVDITLQNPQLQPVADNAKELSETFTQHAPVNKRLAELKSILSKPIFQQLLVAHDSVANQIAESRQKIAAKEAEHEYLYERASQYGEESIRIVRLVKGAEPLGATIKNSGDAVLIGRIVKGGIAEKSDLLHEGDEILEINGIDIRGKGINEVCDIMAGLTGTLTFLTVPTTDNFKPESSVVQMHIRALFNYDPDEDLFIPCRELGITFSKGDILHVISQEDANWWQAFREGEDDHSLAGLIPSRSFWEQHEAMKLSILADTAEATKNSKNGCHCLRKNNKKKNEKEHLAEEAGEILTYEEVALYYPQPSRKRPVVLIGPSNVGRQELRQRLLDTSPERFGAAIPHTSRAARDGEVNGLDYHFVSRMAFEKDIADNQFAEYGEYGKNFYGTTLSAIRQVINSGKICLLNLHPQSLCILRAANDIRPYVVFIAPPNSEKLRQLRLGQKVILSDDEIKEIIESGRQMEDLFGQFFDQIIVNYDLDRAYDELLNAINRLEVEPQWVPLHWVT